MTCSSRTANSSISVRASTLSSSSIIYEVQYIRLDAFQLYIGGVVNCFEFLQKNTWVSNVQIFVILGFNRLIELIVIN